MVAVRTSPSGPLVDIPEGGVLRNLSNVRFVDQGTTATAPDGNIENPYPTFAQGAADLKTVLYVTPGDYFPEGPLVITNPGLAVIGMGLEVAESTGLSDRLFPILPQLRLLPTPGPGIPDFIFRGCSVGITETAFINRVVFRNCEAFGLYDASNVIYVVEGGEFSGAIGNVALVASNAILHSMTASNEFCFIILVNCTFAAGAQVIEFLSVNPRVVQMDQITLASLRATNSTIINGRVKCLDIPSMFHNLVIPAFGAGTTDIVVSTVGTDLAGVKPGDTVTLTWVGTPTATIIFGGIIVTALDTLTIRLFSNVAEPGENVDLVLSLIRTEQ